MCCYSCVKFYHTSIKSQALNFVRFFVRIYFAIVLIGMGRKKINRTKEELNERNRKYRMQFYWKHVKEERKKSLERYYERIKQEHRYDGSKIWKIDSN